MTVLKVSAMSNPKSVAGALAAVVRENGSAEMQAVGAGAVNQSMKAIAIARGYLAPAGINLVAIPSFAEINKNNSDKNRHKHRIFLRLPNRSPRPFTPRTAPAFIPPTPCPDPTNFLPAPRGFYASCSGTVGGS